MKGIHLQDITDVNLMNDAIDDYCFKNGIEIHAEDDSDDVMSKEWREIEEKIYSALNQTITI